MARLKIAGTWSGVIEVELEVWTMPMLRAELANRSNCGPDSINIFCAGRILKDGDGTQKLIELGLKDNAKILASCVFRDEGKYLKEGLMAEEERSSRLARIKAAAVALSKRHADGSLPIEDFNIELEDQSQQKVNLGSQTDQSAVMTALMLHANAKQLIKKQNYKDALEVLSMGEEAFSLCNPKVIELIDNVPILQLDMVWCYFMLRDISWLSVAGIRLKKARDGIERAHGKDSTRIRLLQAGRYPEIALHLRLELLEGVVAYHNGQLEKASKAMTSAQAKYVQLQVPDEALSLLISMGYKEDKAKRALRMTNQEVGRAIDFLDDERAKRERKQEEDIRRKNEIMEQKRYGMTLHRKPVDLQRLQELVSIGFEKELAAEALRRNENDTQEALDDLTDPETNSAIQINIELRRKKRQRKTTEAIIEELISMGFERSRVVAAVQACGTKEQALSQLLGGSEPNPVAANSSVPPRTNAGTVGLSNEAYLGGSSSSNGKGKQEMRDVEMEDELAGELRNGDALSDYDIDVTKEGEAVKEYLAMLASAGYGERASSSHLPNKQ